MMNYNLENLNLQKPGNNPLFYKIISSILGDLLIIADKNNLLQLSFIAQKDLFLDINKLQQSESAYFTPDKNIIVAESERQLQAYFQGKLKDFSVPLRFRGTEFQNKVWQALLAIPYGKTWTYQQQAFFVGTKCPRAIGTANGKNNLPIIVPCHRVIGKNNKLTGYYSGIWRKKFLLDLEKNS